MFKTIEGAADCEIRSVTRFLNARPSLKKIQIHYIELLKHVIGQTGGSFKFRFHEHFRDFKTGKL